MALSPCGNAGRLDCRRKPNVVSTISTAQIRRQRYPADIVGLRIRLLGPIMVENEGNPVVISSKKARALLGYLALREGIEVSREMLSGLLWGERSEAQARASLRQTLSELKRALGEGSCPVEWCS
jgi:two-component SAPR family response regulator